MQPGNWAAEVAEPIAEDAATLVAGHLESEDKMKLIMTQMHQLKLQKLSLIKTKIKKKTYHLRRLYHPKHNLCLFKQVNHNTFDQQSMK